MTTNLYIYKKEIDWSVLHLGINIPIYLQYIFYQNIKLRLKKGESKKIKLLIEGVEYPVILTNIKFDEEKYPDHKELLQIRYNTNSEIAQKLRNIFCCSYEYLYTEKQKLRNKKRQISVPVDIREYAVIYSTVFEDMFSIECVTHNEILGTQEAIRNYNELEIEQIINAVDNSSLIEKERIVKIRKVDKTISDNLKNIYNFRCQICGQLIGELYNAMVIHAHHIEYFSVSLNNNAD
jgi:hypothetical protein